MVVDSPRHEKPKIVREIADCLAGLDKSGRQDVKGLFVSVVEVEVEVKQRLRGQFLLEVFYDGGA